jgi:hypothetical protein
MSRPASHHAAVGWSALHEAIQANPHRGSRLLGTTASATIAAMPATETSLSWLPGWKEDTVISVSDAVSLFLWVSDPLYRVAVAGVRHTMEMEVASALLNDIEKEWKARGGRHRGWVRKHLEEDLRARSAGADPAPDFWEVIRPNKRTHTVAEKRAALLLDYICVVRGVRVALWWPSQKTATMVPLTGVVPSAGVINLNGESGHVLLGPSTASWRFPAVDWAAAAMAKAVDIAWVAPLCAPSAGNQTIAQIQERLTAVGAPSVTGGGKAAMWSRYLWQTLINSLNGVEKPDVSALSSESD